MDFDGTDRFILIWRAAGGYIQERRVESRKTSGGGDDGGPAARATRTRDKSARDGVRDVERVGNWSVSDVEWNLDLLSVVSDKLDFVTPGFALFSRRGSVTSWANFDPHAVVQIIETSSGCFLKQGRQGRTTNPRRVIQHCFGHANVSYNTDLATMTCHAPLTWARHVRWIERGGEEGHCRKEDDDDASQN